MTRLHEHYQKKVVPALQEALGVKNALALPRLVKVVLNIGMGRVQKDAAFQQTVISTLERITGQHPVLTKAKKSIAAFKLREGMVIGAMVTLRGQQMEEFIDKLIHITLPRIRDFRGLNPKSVVDGIMTIGVKEHTVFPEIGSDEIERMHGLEVSIVTTSKRSADTMRFLKLLGLPFGEAHDRETDLLAPKRRLPQRIKE